MYFVLKCTEYHKYVKLLICVNDKHHRVSDGGQLTVNRVSKDDLFSLYIVLVFT